MTVPVYKILLLMKRKQGMSVEAFRAYYEDHHAPLAMKYSQGLSRYIRRFVDYHPHPETGNPADGPDVITELWFKDKATYDGTLAYMTSSLMPADIIADEDNLFDRSSFRIVTVVEHETEF